MRAAINPMQGATRKWLFRIIGVVALTAAQRSQLESQQLDDMEARYAELVGKRRLESALWVARDPASSAIIGCVGCEVAVVKPVDAEGEVCVAGGCVTRGHG